MICVGNKLILKCHKLVCDKLSRSRIRYLQRKVVCITRVQERGRVTVKTVALYLLVRALTRLGDYN